MIRDITESSSCLKLILGAENDPDTAKHRGRKREGRVLGGELWRGGQEEYKWDWREGKVLGGCDAADAECRSAREWKWVYVGATVELRAAEGERQRGVEICWEEADVRSTRSTRCNPKHRGHVKLIERERERDSDGRKDSAERRQLELLSQSQSQNTRN